MSAKTEAPEKPASTEELLAQMQATIEKQGRELAGLKMREGARRKAAESQPVEGMAAFLEEQNAGGGPAVRNRPDTPTEGDGNTLPVAPFYRLTAPWRDPETAKPTYTGVTANVPFYNGYATIPDREKAWALHTDFGYAVEPIFETQKVVAVDLVPMQPAERAAPGGMGPAS